MTQKFESFNEFYPYYLQQHVNPVCRCLHVVGMLVSLSLASGLIITGNAMWLWCVPLVGYSFSWVGHFVFEKNKPATLGYPVYSLMGDFRMVAETLLPARRRKSSSHNN